MSPVKVLAASGLGTSRKLLSRTRDVQARSEVHQIKAPAATCGNLRRASFMVMPYALEHLTRHACYRPSSSHVTSRGT